MRDIESVILGIQLASGRGRSQRSARDRRRHIASADMPMSSATSASDSPSTRVRKIVASAALDSMPRARAAASSSTTACPHMASSGVCAGSTLRRDTSSPPAIAVPSTRVRSSSLRTSSSTLAATGPDRWLG